MLVHSYACVKIVIYTVELSAVSNN